MTDARPPRRSLESLRKEAKRWLAALRQGDPDARARLERALAPRAAPSAPTLRDVQLALAREHGLPGWSALAQAVEAAGAARAAAAGHALAHYEAAAQALLDAYRTGAPAAMARHHAHTWHPRAWPAMRRYVQLDLGKRPAAPDDDVEVTLDDARHLVAVDHGFESWQALAAFARETAARETAARETAARETAARAAAAPGAVARAPLAARPVRLVDPAAPEGAPPAASSRDWEAVLAALAERPTLRLAAGGETTDALLGRVCDVPGVTALDLAGSRALGDDGVRHLARLPGLTHLDLSGTAVGDRGLEVLRHLPSLEWVSLAGTRVTDEGAAQLARCPALRHVDLSRTRTGDGALRALAGKEALRVLRTGDGVTDAGIPLLHEIPAFETWLGGEAELALTSYDASPNQLTLRGPLTDRGMAAMRGLDGLFGLNVDDRALAFTARAMKPLVELPNLGHLAADAKDDWMPLIAEMPRLRFLGAQDTAAGDDGFVALSRSRSIEYVWGRRCHNLRRRGFTALAAMPALRGLSVSCLNVDDAGLAALPSFPALRELMPIDVPDAGYRHVGACERLESLILMYCRDTTDAATEHVARLPRLTHYFNSYTTVTDRTPELLSGMQSLERVTFDACHGLTDAGVARLARLPRLRELGVSGRGLTARVADAFPPRVAVRWAPA